MQGRRAEEEWRPIPGYPGYEASNTGCVRSKDRVIRVRRGAITVAQSLRGKVLKTQPLPSGYRRVKIAGTDEYVHRLVLLTFVGECPAGMECAHGDGDRANNHLNNLEWKTHQANCSDRYRHGTVHYGMGNPAWTGDRCGKGHPYTKENTRLQKRGKNIIRHCRTCCRERMRSPHLSPGKVFMTTERIELATRMLAERRHIEREILPALKLLDGPAITRSPLYAWTKHQKRLMVPAHSLEDR